LRKTELAAHLAAATGRRLYPINMGATTDPRTTLIGTTHSRNGQTIFCQSLFVDGIQDSLALILLDEISRAIHEASHILFPMLDSQGYLALDESHPPARVEKDPNAVLFATANFGEGYTGTREMDRALKDRFTIVELDYPPTDIENQLLVSRARIGAKDAAALVRIANECRSQWRKGELSSPVVDAHADRYGRSDFRWHPEARSHETRHLILL
jgi:nitric oxide reductase NorQ protein